MRRKSVTALTIIYLALCVSYGTATGGFIPNSSDNIEIVQTSTDTDTSTYNKLVSSSIDLQSDTSSKPEEKSEKDTSSSESFEISSAPESDTEAEIESEEEVHLSEPEESSEEEELPEETEPEIEVIEEDWEASVEQYVVEEQEEQAEDSEEYIEEQTEQELNVPTLEEFLQNLRCSGCRHNCSLLSPRCMNGARKAASAESEYYQMYSQQ